MNTSRDLLSSQNGFPETTDPLNTLQDLNFKQIIARSRPHTWIDLRHQQLTDQNMETVAQQAIIDKQCTVLDLGSNNVTSQGVSILGNALRNCTSIKRLYLGDNQIADDGVEELALSVENSTLIVLGLSRNGITDVGAQHLGKMLKENRHLTVLGLEDNRISDRGVELLANALKYNNKLERLLLAENNRISDSSFNALVDMLQHNHSLNKLDLRACTLSNSVKTRLQAVVQTKTNFQLLY
jgi:Ran GTPase-activating protein (RanGAP) involved in mRNA processing and transport